MIYGMKVILCLQRHGKQKAPMPDNVPCLKNRHSAHTLLSSVLSPHHLMPLSEKKYIYILNTYIRSCIPTWRADLIYLYASPRLNRLPLFYLTSGQPPRRTEISTLF